MIIPKDNIIENEWVRFDNHVLRGMNQPMICFQGGILHCRIYEIKRKDLHIKHVYTAYAFDASIDGELRLLLFREEIDEATFGMTVFSKYLVPKGKREVQRFHTYTHTNDKYDIVDGYNQFVEELSEKIFGTKIGFYLNAMEILSND